MAKSKQDPTRPEPTAEMGCSPITATSPSRTSTSAGRGGPARWAQYGADRLVAAFDAGRLRRELRYHAVQARFEQEYTFHTEWTRIAAGQLGLRARMFRPTSDERRLVNEEITATLENLIGYLDHEVHKENLADFFLCLTNQDEDWDQVRPIRAALQPVYKMLGSIDKMLITGLEESEKLALELGDLVDQGIHYKDIEYIFIKRCPVCVEGEREGEGFTRYEVSMSSSKPRRAQVSEDWLEEVVHRAAELNIAHLLPAEIRDRPIRDVGWHEGSTLLYAEPIVEALDVAIRGGLARACIRSTIAGVDSPVDVGPDTHRPSQAGDGTQAIPAKVADDSPPSQASETKKNRCTLTSEERNIKVREYLNRSPKASSSKIAKSIRCSKTSVAMTTAWLVNQQSLKAKSDQSVRAVHLSDKLLASVGEYQDPSGVLEMRDEVRIRRHIECSFGEDRANFLKLSENQQIALLDAIEEQRKDT